MVEKCFVGLRQAGVDPSKLKCELGLSKLGKWMNFRAYFLEKYNYKPADGKLLGLRLECFNSVEGASRLVILIGWIRFVCSNGLVIMETKAALRDVHNENLDLERIPEIVSDGLTKVEADLERIKSWEAKHFDQQRLDPWINKDVSRRWGKKAACRVYHTCNSGNDVEITDPFAVGDATEKPVVFTVAVPRAANPSKTLYDVSQALSWVATRRTNAEDRLIRQTEVPRLIASLAQN